MISVEASPSYYRARYYDNLTGRFLNEDPARIAAGPNFYAYVYNSPNGLPDPYGLCPPSRKQRLLMAGAGAFNIVVGIGKAAGGIALTAETGGLGAAFGYYGIVSGIVGNIGGGISQLAGAATGNVEGGEQGANAFAAASSVTGFGALLATKGNLCKAGAAAQAEGIATAPLQKGLGPTIGKASKLEWPDKWDFGHNILDALTGKGCEPKPSQECKNDEKCPH